MRRADRAVNRDHRRAVTLVAALFHDVSINHHRTDMRQLLERIPVEQCQIPGLPRLERPDPLLHPQDPGCVDRNAGHCLIGRYSPAAATAASNSTTLVLGT